MDEALKKLIEDLDFPEEELETAALHQAALFERASRFYIRAMRHTLQLKSALQEREARLSLAIRKVAQEEAAAAGKSRSASEAQISARVKSSKTIAEGYVKLHQAETDEEYLRLLLDAFKMRRDTIRVLAELRRSDMGESVVKAKEISASEAAQEVTEKLKKRWPGE